MFDVKFVKMSLIKYIWSWVITPNRVFLNKIETYTQILYRKNNIMLFFPCFIFILFGGIIFLKNIFLTVICREKNVYNVTEAIEDYYRRGFFFSILLI